MSKKKDPKDIIFKKSHEPKDLLDVKGYDFDKPFDKDKFLDSFLTTGFQATHLGKGIQIIKKMRKAKATIFLAYTSNMISSGLREEIAYLVKHKMVDVLVTTAGGVEEDIIKTLKPFLISDFVADDLALREEGVNRIGNILVPNDRYCDFEDVMTKFFKRMYEETKDRNHTISCSEFIYELGKEVKDENSIYYWATKHNIPVFCPALTDGSIGDMLYFFKKKNPDFKLDISDDIVRINSLALNSEKTGVICLGGGLPKHHVINANLYRDGTDFAVYVSTGIEGDGSLSGAPPKEGISWGKLRAESTHVQIFGDASIVFPLLVLGGFS